MKLIVAGSRTFTDLDYVYKSIDKVLDQVRKKPTWIISGGAKGVDTYAEKYALDRKINFHCFNAEWSKHGKAAGPLRNKRMAEKGDMLIAIWDGQSRGTRDMIDQMKKLNKPVFVVKDDSVYS